MPATRRREVGAVIEVEAAQVVLVGLALAAVLADDDAGHGLEHLAGPRHRARASSWRDGDCALARGLRHADEVLRRTLRRSARFANVRIPGHRDVGAQGQVEDDVRARAGSGQVDIPTGGREIDSAQTRRR